MIAVLPAFSDPVPVTEIVPLSVMAPVEVSAKLPLIVEAARSTAPVAATMTFLPVSASVPPKAFVDVPSVISPVPALTVVFPVTSSLPVFVMAPVVVTDSVPPAVMTPSFTAPVAVMATLLPTNANVPPNVFVEVFKERLSVFASIVTFPPTASFPVFVTAPPGETVSVPVSEDAPRIVANVFVTAAFDPVKEIAPV